MSVAPILRTSLVGGGIFAGVLAVVAGGLGFLLRGMPGLYGGLLGAVLAAVFLGLTAGSILLAARLSRHDPNGPVFYGVILAIWLAKLILFFVILFPLRGAPMLDPYVLPFTMIAGVLGSLTIDAYAVMRSRVPYVSDVVIPGESREGPSNGTPGE